YDPGAREVWALRDVNLSVRRGEFVAVVGANGSGKSTLARHLNALLLPTTGRVEVAGFDTSDPAHLWEIRRRVGMVFQNPDNQLVATTVEEDVAFGPENLGLPREEIARRVDEALRLVRLEAFRRHAPHRLSGGQKQRVAIAGILAMRPDIIVMDEPTAMLDPRGREEVVATAWRLCRGEGITVVYVTHFMEEAVRADRIVVLAEGRVQAEGAPTEVFARRELLRSAGLELPGVVELAERLRQRGLDVPGDLTSLDELVTHLCRLRSKA
ncbi:MAG TPA: energy-coupling factor transporter ATPase, partial [Bacillota bacterium]